MNTHRQVGKISANWNPLFANWIQLADPCQLHSFVNQPLELKLASWQVGNAANLPTDANPHGYWVSPGFSVGENSPLPTGEVDTPDYGRGVHLVLGRRPVVCMGVVQVAVGAMRGCPVAAQKAQFQRGPRHG
ncbi:hypothetical protein [Kluyvera genomosp. 2]|uniref:hypothetical protein n=1 Tax=Kluyvera genomosp. 2 TaxID=2774054 RepID=UPI002FD80AE0